MTLNEFIEDTFNTEHQYLMDALGDLTPEELMWRAGSEANPIGWILWHMTRVEDMWFQFFIQRQAEIDKTINFGTVATVQRHGNGKGEILVPFQVL